jgi:hypothetical protein
MINHGSSEGPKKIFWLWPSMAAKVLPWHLLNLPQQLSSHPQACSDCMPRVVGNDSGPTYLSADHDLCWIQNCYTLKTTCSLEALDFQIMWLHFFPNSGARNTVTNGEQPSVENSTHHQSWDAQRATPDDPKNGLMNGPRCQRHIPHPRHNATTHLHLIDHVTMWPYFRMTWGTTTNLREKNKTWFPSQLFVAQTWCRMPKKKTARECLLQKG